MPAAESITNSTPIICDDQPQHVPALRRGSICTACAVALVLGWPLDSPAATPSAAPAPEAGKTEAKEKDADSAKASDPAKGKEASSTAAAGNSRRSPRDAHVRRL